jgi:hypothetical protein
MATGHRVQTWGKPKVRFQVPADRFEGRTFIGGDGTVYEVVASGRMPTPLRPEWMGGPVNVRVPAKLHLSPSGVSRQ